MKEYTKIIIQESFPFDENLVAVEGVNERGTYTIFGASANKETGSFEVHFGDREHHVVVSLDELVEALRYAKTRLEKNWPNYLKSKKDER